MLSIKKKFGSYKNRWTKRHLLGFEKNLNNVSVQTVNFSEKVGVWFINLRWRFCTNERNEIFLTRVVGGGETRTLLDRLDTDSPILVCSRLSDRGKGAKRYEQKKIARPLLFHLPFFFFILLLYVCVTALLYQVSGRLTTFKLAVSLRPV